MSDFARRSRRSFTTRMFPTSNHQMQGTTTSSKGHLFQSYIGISVIFVLQTSTIRNESIENKGDQDFIASRNQFAYLTWTPLSDPDRMIVLRAQERRTR